MVAEAWVGESGKSLKKHARVEVYHLRRDHVPLGVGASSRKAENSTHRVARRAVMRGQRVVVTEQVRVACSGWLLV